MVGGGAVAGLAIARENAVYILRDLDRSPIDLAQSGDQAGAHAGLAHAARRPANDDQRHVISSSPGALALPVASDTRGPAAPVFPRTLRLCPAILYSAALRLGLRS